MKSIDLIETYAYETSKDLVSEKNEKWLALMIIQHKRS